MRDNARLERAIDGRGVEPDIAWLETLQRLAQAGRYHDHVSAGHPRRVSRGVKILSLELGYSERAASLLGGAAMLHDIGNVGIPAEILLRTTPQSASEQALLRGHVEHGTALLASDGSPLLQVAREIIASHHEHWDGSGYPAGLRGHDIPVAARIAAVVDAFHRLTGERPGRPANGPSAAVALIAAASGSRFDPEVVRAFMRLDHRSLLADPSPGPRPSPSGSGAPSAAWARWEPARAQATKTVGLAEAAAALGVSTSTLRRWADSGRVASERTEGGHRRFSGSELRAARLPLPRDESAVKPAPLPSTPVPAAADALLADSDHLTRNAAHLLYDGGAGFWGSDRALEIVRPWARSVAACLLVGDYSPAGEATRRLMDRAALAGTTRLERHRFLERLPEVLVRQLERGGDLRASEGTVVRRLFANLRHVLLDDEPPTHS